MKEIFRNVFQPRWLLVYIIFFAFLIRIAGVGYGLPLWLIDDEPPFTLAALKMIQLKTLLPMNHLEEFKTVLYYPPHLSYLYLLPFSILLGIKYLLFKGGLEQFVYYLTSDLSQFFLIARFINILLGVFSVFLIYRIAIKIFGTLAGNAQKFGLLAAFFLATSLMHISLSVAGRHWLPMSFLAVLTLWFLNLDWDFRRRYFAAVLVVGIGSGISMSGVLLLTLIGYWYIFYEKRALPDLFKERYFYGSLIVFALLVMLPGILYSNAQTFDFWKVATFRDTKSFWGIIVSPFLFLKPVALSEPVLMLFALVGLAVIVFYQSRLFGPFFLFIYTYSAIFYLFFRYEHRFTLPLFPILAIVAAYGVMEIYKRFNHRFFVTLLILTLATPAVFSLRLSYLLYHNDSRILAMRWTEENLPAGAKIMTLARLTRFSTTKAAVEEQRKIDEFSLRKRDLADAESGLTISGKPNFHALNLFDAGNQTFYENVENYIKQNGYEYLVIQPTYKNSRYFKNVLEKSELLAAFGNKDYEHDPSLAESQFLGNPFTLFKINELGPEIKIYKLK